MLSQLWNSIHRVYEVALVYARRCSASPAAFLAFAVAVRAGSLTAAVVRGELTPARLERLAVLGVDRGRQQSGSDRSAPHAP